MSTSRYDTATCDSLSYHMQPLGGQRGPSADIKSAGVVIALVLDHAERARMIAALGGAECLHFCTLVHELAASMEVGDVGALITELRDAAGASVVPTLRTLRERFPSLPIVLSVAVPAVDVHGIMAAATAGADAVLVRHVDDVAMVVHSAMARSTGRTARPDRPAPRPAQSPIPRQADRVANSILVIEDDATVRHALDRLLRADGYIVHVAVDGEEGMRRALDLAPNTILLDLELPARYGLDVLRDLRRRGNDVPVIVVTGHAQPEDIVAAYEAGANDYIAKPFILGELRARVSAALRSAAARTPTTAVRVADLVADPLARRAMRGTRVLALTPKEFDLLYYLMRHAGRVVTLEMMATNVWHHAHPLASKMYTVCLSVLRRKLQDAGEPPLLHTLRGEGYLLEASRAAGARGDQVSGSLPR